jgi:hypothetical protein
MLSPGATGAGRRQLVRVQPGYRGCAGFTGPGDTVDLDPLLGPLDDNGGPTSTRALLSGSPATDAGDDQVCAAPPVDGVDQRGYPRQYHPHCDIGAFEVQPGYRPRTRPATGLSLMK